MKKHKMPLNAESIPYSRRFVSRLRDQFPKEADDVLEALNMPAPISIRFNPNKSEGQICTEAVPWAADGYYLQERPYYALDPIFHAGGYYPQEASSMSLEIIIKKILSDTESGPVRILDLCAAPGGKSTHISSMISSDSVLVSNEIVPKRGQILFENLSKWGNPNFIVTNSRLEELIKLGPQFDIVVVDAPCSGEGLFRKQVDWREKWTIANCELCANRQERILNAADQLVRPSGFLVYSTCTFNAQENIDQLQYLHQHFDYSSIDFPQLGAHGFHKIEDKNVVGYQSLPHRVKGEPFFIGAVQKPGASPVKKFKRRKSEFVSYTLPEPAFFDADNLFTRDHRLHQLNKEQLQLAELLNIHKVRCRIPTLAELKKDLLLPSHFSAMTTHLTFYVPMIEMTLSQALTYLRHERQQNIEVSKGWNLVSYLDTTLGWVKSDGRRINNKYPMSWRLKM